MAKGQKGLLEKSAGIFALAQCVKVVHPVLAAQGSVRGVCSVPPEACNDFRCVKTMRKRSAIAGARTCWKRGLYWSYICVNI